MNGRFQIALHILSLLGQAGNELLSSDYIAGSVNANPALIRKEIGNLSKNGLIKSKEGKTGGYAISKPAEQITLGDIYVAVSQNQGLGFAKNTPNPLCPIGKQINQRLGDLYKNLDHTLMAQLNAITLKDFTQQFD